jgi:hypothetical protein
MHDVRTFRYFRSEETGDSVLIIPVGNVTADTELTYEYGVRTDKKSPASPATDQDKGEQKIYSDMSHYRSLFV